MPTIYVTMWDKYDNKFVLPLQIGKNGKRRTRPQPVKQTRLQRIVDEIKRLLRL